MGAEPETYGARKLHEPVTTEPYFWAAAVRTDDSARPILLKNSKFAAVPFSCGVSVRESIRV